jgi:hypothetical protein
MAYFTSNSSKMIDKTGMIKKKKKLNQKDIRVPLYSIHSILIHFYIRMKRI